LNFNLEQLNVGKNKIFMKVKKVAVVGFGFMGMTHTANILKQSGLQLVAIVSKRPENIDSKITESTGNFSTGEIDAKALAAINKYSSLEECIEKETLDAIFICVHTDLHFEMTKLALSNGIHVFLEKPMVLDVNQGQKLIDLAKTHNCMLMVGHVLRFMSPYMKLKKWIDDKTYGELKFLSLTRFSGLPSWGQWKEKKDAFGSSGGALFDLLIHDIDFAQYLLGTPDQIQSTYLPGSLSEHDYISALWSYDSKEVKVKVEGGNTFHSNFPFQAGFMANFEGASILYTTLKPEIIQVANNDEVKEMDANDGGDGFFNEIVYFTSCLVNNQSPDQCLPESSLETVKICYQHLNKK